MSRNIAIIGCGSWGKNLARNLHELGALSAIADPSAQAKALADQYGLPYYETYNEILEDPAFRAVVVATPAASHFEIVRQFLQADKDVYVEKPIALSTDEGLELERIAKDRALILMVGHLLHYHPVYLKLKELVLEGGLGAIRHITSTRQNFGTLRHEENVMWSFSPHDISMVLGLTGKTPEAVSAIGNDFLQPGIIDNYTSQLRFSDGFCAEVRASWFNPDKVQKLVVVGSEAIAIFSDTAEWDKKLVMHKYAVNWVGPRPVLDRGDTVALAVPQSEPLKAEMKHFLECISKRQKPRTDAAEANGVLAVLQAAQVSLDNKGEWVNV